MLQSIDLQEAQRGSWDVLVVGSSFSAMFFLKGPDPKLRVLIVDRGAVVDHEKQVGIGGVRPEEFDIHNTSGHPKNGPHIPCSGTTRMALIVPEKSAALRTSGTASQRPDVNAKAGDK